jgi:hypothetical protein
MKTSVKDLTFPVVTLEGSIVYLIKDTETITSCSPDALRTGYFKKLKIICMDGRQFAVKSANKVGVKKPWWKTPMFLTILVVSLELEEASSVTLDELKSSLLKAFRADRASWESVLGYKEFAAEVKKCQSFREVVDYLGQF